jgi:predicted TIM-barrel fold metal-dependent hydrolase
VFRRWVIDGVLIPKPFGKGGQAVQTPPVDPQRLSSRQWMAIAMIDIDARLEDADAMGVDVQIVYPTLFNVHLTFDPELDVALARAYNRFMAKAWSLGRGRIRWVAVPALHDLGACIRELAWCREHGAVGFLARGIEGERSLAEPYFFPLYEAVGTIDMPMCIHAGQGCPALTAITNTSIVGSFPGGRLLPVIGFHDLVSNRIPERFPDLRILFVEAGASWVPYLLHYLERHWRRRGKLQAPHLGPDLFRDYRIYVTCESDEDLPYLTGFVGEHNLLSGSDYGHHGEQVPTLEPISFNNRLRGGDPSADLAIVGELRARSDVTSDAVRKILVENPRRFYGI